SVTGVKSANLVGSISKNGIPNVAIFSSVFHLGSNPALLGFIIRPANNFRRDTYKNIISTNYFTINNIHVDFVSDAHATSAHFNENISEFDSCNLKEEYIEGFLAPFVSQSNLKIGLKLIEEIDIKSNNSKIIVGSIEHLFYPNDIEGENGNLNLQKLNDVGIGGLDTYYKLEKFCELPYARVSNTKIN
ncbi:flavin reductase, partial [Flavobacteriales bacterium]|nr:flavin reductase [Flavobacteriales bacterium]